MALTGLPGEKGEGMSGASWSAVTKPLFHSDGIPRIVGGGGIPVGRGDGRGP